MPAVQTAKELVSRSPSYATCRPNVCSVFLASNFHMSSLKFTWSVMVVWPAMRLKWKVCSLAHFNCIECNSFLAALHRLQPIFFDNLHQLTTNQIDQTPFTNFFLFCNPFCLFTVTNLPWFKKKKKTLTDRRSVSVQERNPGTNSLSG